MLNIPADCSQESSMKTISDGFDYKGKTKSSDTGLLFIVTVLGSQSTVVILDKHDKT